MIKKSSYSLTGIPPIGMNQRFTRRRYVTPQTNTMYQNAGVTPQTNIMYQSAGVTPQINSMYRNAGVTPQTNIMYQNAGVTPHTKSTYLQSAQGTQSIMTQMNTSHHSSTTGSTGHTVHHSYMRYSETGNPDKVQEHILIREPGVPTKVRTYIGHNQMRLMSIYKTFYLLV